MPDTTVTVHDSPINGRLIVPDARDAPVPRGWFERVALPVIENADWEALDEMESSLKALASYIESMGHDGVEYEKALRIVERRRGELLDPDVSQGSRTDLHAPVKVDVPRQTATRYRKLARAWDEVIWPHLLRAEQKHEVSQSACLRLIENGTAHVSHNAGEHEWYTPTEYIEAARESMGTIDLDPASTKVANEIVKATHFFTKEDDGLSRTWVGNVWMNPPYAQPLVDHFSEKLASEYLNGAVSQAIVLVNNATETKWWQRLAGASSSVCFPKGRVRFLDPDGNPGAPLQGQTILYLGVYPEKFRGAFHSFGYTK